MNILSIGAAFALATIGATALAADQSISLQVTVFPCEADATVAPSLGVTAITRPPAKVDVAPSWRWTGSVWQADVALPPGRYLIGANSPHCSGEYENWMAIPGAERHLALTINKRKIGTIGDTLGVVYGVLPTSDARVEILRADGLSAEQTRRTAQLDGDTYQVQNVRPGTYVVRVSFGDVLASRTVTVGRTYDGLTVRADLTVTEAASIVRQQANGSRFVRAPNDQNRAVSFQLGAASAGAWTTEP
jgi:hypothetical protein